MIKRAIVILFLFALSIIFADFVMEYQADKELNSTGLYYAEHTAQDIGAANIVTAIIVTYRGLDTLGEVTVLFLTAAIVGLLLSKGAHSSGLKSVHGQTSTKKRVKSGELLTTGSYLLVPLILLLGAYVFINGHLTPGGGFQGGAIVASGILLLLLTDPMRKFSHQIIATVESISGLLFLFIGVLGIFFAGGFLDNSPLPLGEFGSLFSAGAIPFIYSLVGLKVGAEFSSMLVNLSATKNATKATKR